jgi:hypothetical protein
LRNARTLRFGTELLHGQSMSDRALACANGGKPTFAALRTDDRCARKVYFAKSHERPIAVIYQAGKLRGSIVCSGHISVYLWL